MVEVKEKKFVDWFRRFYISHGISIKEINLFSIRNEADKDKDVFNDVMGIFNHKTDTIYLFRGSADPSAYWTKNGGAGKYRKGVAHLCYGYQKNIFCVDKHKGKYKALCNRWEKGCNPTTFWRDSNMNFVQDFGEKAESGYIGINFHRTSEWSAVENIGKYSAGCQLINDPEDFDKFLQIVCASDMYRKTKLPTLFSYYIFSMNEAPIDLYYMLFPPTKKK